MQSLLSRFVAAQTFLFSGFDLTSFELVGDGRDQTTRRESLVSVYISSSGWWDRFRGVGNMGLHNELLAGRTLMLYNRRRLYPPRISGPWHEVSCVFDNFLCGYDIPLASSICRDCYLEGITGRAYIRRLWPYMIKDVRIFVTRAMLYFAVRCI
jgi:hypothetical protein